MPLGSLSRLGGRERDERSDRLLGYTLAAVAGAVNAGGFLAVGAYTSHMTGIVSGVADHLVLGTFSLAAAGFAAWCAFVAGAGLTAILVNWGRRRGMHSQYALPLLLEAVLLFAFGLAGAHGGPPLGVVVLLCFMMGLQNAIITKISGARIRTTHVTGLSTDIGIELGKLVYVNRTAGPRVDADRPRLRMQALLVACFFLGGALGAAGFSRAGYAFSAGPAAVLVLLALGPVLRDLRGAQ